MTGGLQQQGRVARFVANKPEFRPFPGFDPADGADRHVELDRGNPCEPQIVPAETLQADDLDAIGDPVALIRSIGWRRLVIAAAFMAAVWIGTAAFAVTFGGPQ
jgi:hypothetical protein